VKLPHVPFELLGFLMLVGFLMDVQNRQAAIDAKYIRDMGWPPDRTRIVLP
jgi:hypothetical protein